MSSPHLIEGFHVEEAYPKGSPIRIPELEGRENARWLALLMDTEGALGWTRFTKRADRMDKEWRYMYAYRIPYIGVEMDELEARDLIDEGARLIGVPPYTYTKDEVELRRFSVGHGRALSAMGYMKPHLVKFRRLANLCLTLFKYHTYIPIERFDKVIETLFGTYLEARETNPLLLMMTEKEFEELMRRAEELTNRYLA